MRSAVGVYKSPLSTLFYFFTGVIPQKIGATFQWLSSHQSWVASALVVLFLYIAALLVEGPQQQAAQISYTFLKMCAWWVGLGILSSIGLGTGLHTFVLYLGPFIASATLAATECNSTNFERYGPARFICPTDADKSAAAPQFTDIFKIVALEAFLWGAGTAIGELPPYFVARAARLAGQRVAELDEGAEEIKQDTSFIGKIKQLALNRLGNLGFIGIMLFASIPNPLFDLAGLTCGHMLVPFWTFFGATLIGKAVIKVSLQSIFVITVFSKEHLETLIYFIETYVPAVSGKAQATFEGVRKQYHRQPGQEIETGGKNPLTLLWDVFLAGMVLYFVLSIIDSAVQEHLVSVHEEEVELERKKHEAEQKSEKSRKPTQSSDSAAEPTQSADTAEVAPEPTTSLRSSGRISARNQSNAVETARPPSPTRRSSRLSPTLSKKNN